jgi:hypothetical protein
VTALYPDVEQLAAPMTAVLNQRWDELLADQEIVALDRRDHGAFLRASAALAHFGGLSSELRHAARKA